MFTPQKLWSLAPKRGAGSGSKPHLGPNSGDGTVAKGKSVAIFEAKTPASGSVLENGDGGLVGSDGATMDREVLVERVSSLENEVSQLVTFILCSIDTPAKKKRSSVFY